jgi:6-phospho-beta-glucosidase
MAKETGKGHAEMDPVFKAAMDTGGYAGVALDLIEGLVGGGTRIMTLNILNQGAVAGMQPDDVVEVPAVVSKGLVRPLAVGEIPPVCLGLMQQVKSYERLTIAAAMEGSYAKALQALILHPLIGDAVKARTILDGYRREHGKLFPTLH